MIDSSNPGFGARSRGNGFGSEEPDEHPLRPGDSVSTPFILSWTHAVDPLALERAMPAYWLSRLYVSLSVLSTIFVTATEPFALSHWVMLANGGEVKVGLVVLGILAAICAIDSIGNDLFAPRMFLPLLRQFRHVTFMLMALGMVSFCGLIAITHGWSAVVASYGIDGAAAVAVAFLDLFARHRRQ